MRYALATDSQHWRARELTKELTTETDDTRARKCESAREREGTGDREKRPVCVREGEDCGQMPARASASVSLSMKTQKQVVGPA